MSNYCKRLSDRHNAYLSANISSVPSTSLDDLHDCPRQKNIFSWTEHCTSSKYSIWAFVFSVAGRAFMPNCTSVTGAHFKQHLLWCISGNLYKSSAVAEMGDRGHNRHGRKVGAAVPLPRTAGTTLFRTKWRAHPSNHLATIDMGQKLGGGGCALFSGGSWVPIEHKVAWAEAYLHTKWYLSLSSRLATTDNGRILGGCAPLREESWVPI